MEIQGKIIHNLGEQSGVSKAGNSWKKHEYVLETQESFPKQVHFDFFGERADQYPLNVGDVIKLSFDIESREYNGRWYTSIRVLCGYLKADSTCKHKSQVNSFHFLFLVWVTVAKYGRKGKTIRYHRLM